MSEKQVQEAVPVVECRNVSVRYGGVTALNDLSFQVLPAVKPPSAAYCGVRRSPERGQFIAILGPSGCGKSTLLNLIAGLLTPTEGQILVNGTPIQGPGRDRGMVFQQYSSFPHLTALQNILFGLQVNRGEMGLDRAARLERARELVRQVGLTGHEEKYPHQLSGGQQQRVAIARTLALEPRIILMDEAFSALDEPTRLEMQELVVDLWYRIKPTIFCVTHSVTEAVYLGERVWIFTRAPGQIAYDIYDCIPPSPGISPVVAQERADFRNAAEIVTEAFRRVANGKVSPPPKG